ncbi:MAG: hypothetical protein C0391_00485 [Anaerolinea sp.]|nr:hypothetical protein [Anaerolinea sp.]
MKYRTMLVCVTCLFAILALSACRRPASIRPGTIPDTSSEGLPSGNPAPGLISATQTANALPTPTLESIPTETLIVAAPGSEVTPVDIVSTITPNIPAPTLDVIIIPTLPRPATYTMQPGENPYCIARRFNVDIGELLSINNLTTESLPEPGTLIKIPNTGHLWSSGVRALQPHPTQYPVRVGDTITGIACLFGDVSPEAIIAINQFNMPVTLEGGMVIMIP